MAWLRLRKRLKTISLADDTKMQQRESQANEFYLEILAPDEEPGFVSDEATLRDLSLAPDDDLIGKIQSRYGRTLTRQDFQKPFWSFLDDLEAHRKK